jgi:PAS domain S-box-containing protein
MLDLVGLAGPLSGMALRISREHGADRRRDRFDQPEPVADLAAGLAERAELPPAPPPRLSCWPSPKARERACAPPDGRAAYLTYKMYRTGLETEARQGAILEAAHDAIITMDSHLAIREFNPAAEQMFGHRRSEILGRHVDILLQPDSRTEALDALGQYLHTGRGPLLGRQLEFTGVRTDGTDFQFELTVARVGSETRRAYGRARHHRSAGSSRNSWQSQKLEATGGWPAAWRTTQQHPLSIIGSADLPHGRP